MRPHRGHRRPHRVSTGGSLLETCQRWHFWEYLGKERRLLIAPVLVLVEVVRAYEYRYLKWQPPSPKKMEAFYSTVERLLTVHGADPNSLAESLWLMLERLSEALRAIEDDSDDSDYVPEFDAEALEPLFRHLMRTIDLLVRHGAKSSRTESSRHTAREAAMKPWVLARPDCTQQIRDAVQRGELSYDGI